MSTSSLAVGFAPTAMVPFAEGALTAGGTWVSAKGLAAVGFLVASLVAVANTTGNTVLAAEAQSAFELIKSNPSDLSSWQKLFDMGIKVGGPIGELAKKIRGGAPVVQIPLTPNTEVAMAAYVQRVANILAIPHDRALELLIALKEASHVGLTEEGLLQYRASRQIKLLYP